nr:hypothetical protein [Bacilli bacterium]
MHIIAIKHKKMGIILVGILLILLVLFVLILNSPLFGIYNVRQSPDFLFPGYGLSLVQVNGNTISSTSLMTSRKAKEMNLQVHFANNGLHADQFGLLVFIDGHQVSFHRQADRTRTMTMEKFQLGLHDAITLPISLSLPTNHHIAHLLLLSVVAGPDLHAGDMQSSSISYSVSLQKRITYSGISPLAISLPLSSIRTGYMKYFVGLLINQVGSFDRYNSTLMPPLLLTTRPNEPIKLYAHVGGFPYSSNYYLFYMVGWHEHNFQQSIASLQFHLNKGEATVIPFTFKAPQKTGTYEVTGFVVPTTTYGTKNIPVGPVVTSYRFSLQVGSTK